MIWSATSSTRRWGRYSEAFEVALARRARGRGRAPDVRSLGIALRSLVGHDYARPVLLRIAAISGGNPLFALEIARALGPQPALAAGAPLPVPETLRELVAGRVDGLAPKGREALLAAARQTVARSRRGPRARRSVRP